MDPNPVHLIFRAIKKYGPLKREELQEYTGVPYHELDMYLVAMCVKKWLEVDEGTARFYIVRPLFPPMSDKDRAGPENQFFEYETIQALEGAVPGHLLPEEHPYKQYLPAGWNQAGQYDCVGMATAILEQLNYYACTGDFPTPAEMAAAKANLTVKAGGCSLLYDQWYRTTFSAWFPYVISREMAGLSGTPGSYCSMAIQAVKTVGGVSWDDCYSPKNVFCASEDVLSPKTKGECKEIAKGHKIDGYATISTWEGLKTAILTSPAHCAIMPINVYETGPDPDDNLRMIGKVIGAHALPWTFVDDVKDRVGCWNSWGPTYPQITWIDRDYWQHCAGKAFTPIDKDEVLIAKYLYALVTVDANVPCQFSVNGEIRPEDLTFSAMLEKEKEYLIKAIPKAPENYIESEQYFDLIPFQDTHYTFTFHQRPSPSPDTSWISELFERLRKLFRWVMIRTNGEPIRIGE